MMVSHVVLNHVKRSMSDKEALLRTKHVFCDCCRNIAHFLCGAERVKRFVNVHLHLNSYQPEKDNKVSMLPTLEKLLRTPMAICPRDVP